MCEFNSASWLLVKVNAPDNWGSYNRGMELSELVNVMSERCV